MNQTFVKTFEIDVNRDDSEPGAASLGFSADAMETVGPGFIEFFKQAMLDAVQWHSILPRHLKITGKFEISGPVQPGKPGDGKK